MTLESGGACLRFPRALANGQFLSLSQSPACRDAESLREREMNFRSLVFCLAVFSPAALVAHPGHFATTVHVHVGMPTSGNSMDVWILALAAMGLVASLVRRSSQ
jgi:hypothetical protein